LLEHAPWAHRAQRSKLQDGPTALEGSARPAALRTAIPRSQALPDCMSRETMCKMLPHAHMQAADCVGKLQLKNGRCSHEQHTYRKTMDLNHWMGCPSAQVHPWRIRKTSASSQWHKVAPGRKTNFCSVESLIVANHKWQQDTALTMLNLRLWTCSVSHGPLLQASCRPHGLCTAVDF